MPSLSTSFVKFSLTFLENIAFTHTHNSSLLKKPLKFAEKCCSLVEITLMW